MFNEKIKYLPINLVSGSLEAVMLGIVISTIFPIDTYLVVIIAFYSWLKTAIQDSAHDYLREKIKKLENAQKINTNV